jgi:hypothetical protein
MEPEPCWWVWNLTFFGSTIVLSLLYCTHLLQVLPVASMVLLVHMLVAVTLSDLDQFKERES